MQNIIHIIKTGVFSVNTIIINLGNKKCVVVDPGACRFSRDSDKITSYLQENNLECIACVLTHCHFDHTMGLSELQKVFPKMQIAIHKDEVLELENNKDSINDSTVHFFGNLTILDALQNQPKATCALNDGDTLDCIFNDQSLLEEVKQELQNWKVIHTPGHSPGSICLYNQKENILLSGDTIFDMGGYGRTDMKGGDESLIIQSIQKLYQDLPNNTKVYPGHDSFGFNLS